MQGVQGRRKGDNQVRVVAGYSLPFFLLSAFLAAAPSAKADGLPGFRIELFDGKTGPVSVASRDFAAPAVTRADGRLRLVWRGHPRLGDGFTAMAEGVAKGDATNWTPDILIRPAVGGVMALDFRRAERLVEIGRQAVDAQFPTFS